MEKRDSWEVMKKWPAARTVIRGTTFFLPTIPILPCIPGRWWGRAESAILIFTPDSFLMYRTRTPGIPRSFFPFT